MRIYCNIEGQSLVLLLSLGEDFYRKVISGCSGFLDRSKAVALSKREKLKKYGTYYIYT